VSKRRDRTRIRMLGAYSGAVYKKLSISVHKRFSDRAEQCRAVPHLITDSGERHRSGPQIRRIVHCSHLASTGGPAGPLALRGVNRQPLSRRTRCVRESAEALNAFIAASIPARSGQAEPQAPEVSTQRHGTAGQGEP